MIKHYFHCIQMIHKSPVTQPGYDLMLQNSITVQYEQVFGT